MESQTRRGWITPSPRRVRGLAPVLIQINFQISKGLHGIDPKVACLNSPRKRVSGHDATARRLRRKRRYPVNGSALGQMEIACPGPTSQGNIASGGLIRIVAASDEVPDRRHLHRPRTTLNSSHRCLKIIDTFRQRWRVMQRPPVATVLEDDFAPLDLGESLQLRQPTYASFVVLKPARGSPHSVSLRGKLREAVRFLASQRAGAART